MCINEGIGALLKKVVWGTLTLCFLVFSSLSFAQLSDLPGDDIPPTNFNSVLT